MGIVLTTIPPEIRFMIYKYLFADLTITINSPCLKPDPPWRSRHGKPDPPVEKHVVDTRLYPYQISSTCHLLRRETIPLLRSPNDLCPLHLRWENAIIPPNLKHPLPHFVYETVRVITIWGLLSCIADDDHICIRHFKPGRSQFPHLTRLNLDLTAFSIGDVLDELQEEVGPFAAKPPIPRFWRQMLFKCMRVELNSHARYMPLPQPYTIEQAEKAGVTEGSLYEALLQSRSSRDFPIHVRASVRDLWSQSSDVLDFFFDYDDYDDNLDDCSGDDGDDETRQRGLLTWCEHIDPEY